MDDRAGWAPPGGDVREDVGDVSGAVVVGVDGSEYSRHALRFAAGEAQARGCPLVVVRAWSLMSAPNPPGSQPGVVPALTDFEAAVVAEIEDEVADVLGDAALQASDRRIRTLAVHDDPRVVLAEASRSAVLVVVGHRGHGGVAGLLLGSVSDHLVRHGEGPVAVVR